MKSFAAVIAMAALGVTGLCRADDQAIVGAPSRALKVVLSEFSGRQFAGSVVWHTHNVDSAPELPAMRADVEIPDLGMAVRVELRPTDDDTQPFSHMVELAFTLPPDFSHGAIASVPGLLMKARETEQGEALKGVSVKVGDNLFLFGLSNDDAERRRNVELMSEQPWLDVPIVYSDGKRAIIAVEKSTPSERVRAVPAVSIASGQPRAVPAAAPQATIERVPRVPLDHSPAEVKPWSIVPDASPSGPPDQIPHAATGLPSERLAALPPPVQQPREPVRPKLTLPRLERPTWAWPPGKFWWAIAPGLPSASRTWRAGWQPVLPEMIRIASTVELPAALQAKLPRWVRDTSMAMATADSLPPWPRRRTPDFHLPRGPSGFASEKYLEPPSRFMRWHDRMEVVLSMDEVDRRCRASLGKSPPAGRFYRGCTRAVAGRCLITRIDDPGVARHELAHCNGWKHPE